MITNPTPVVLNTPTFGGLWVQQLSLNLNNTGSMLARLVPYNGTHILASVNPPLVVRQFDATTQAVLANLTAECQRQAGNTDRAVKLVSVSAPEPSKPVTASIVFDSGRPHIIRDCFALAATDNTFGAVLQATLAEVARLNGTTYAP